MDFAKHITLRAHRGSANRTLSLCTHDGADFVNISLSGHGTTTRSADAKALRDALIELYPLPPPKPKPEEYACSHAGTCYSFSQAKQEDLSSPFNASGMGDAATALVPLKWENVADGMDRLEVPGGWIYQSGADGQMIFIKDQKD